MKKIAPVCVHENKVGNHWGVEMGHIHMTVTKAVLQHVHVNNESIAANWSVVDIDELYGSGVYGFPVSGLYMFLVFKPLNM